MGKAIGTTLVLLFLGSAAACTVGPEAGPTAGEIDGILLAVQPWPGTLESASAAEVVALVANNGGAMAVPGGGFGVADVPAAVLTPYGVVSAAPAAGGAVFWLSAAASSANPPTMAWTRKDGQFHLGGVPLLGRGIVASAYRMAGGIRLELTLAEPSSPYSQVILDPAASVASARAILGLAGDLRPVDL
ncbi:MAG: hypothetical protein KGR26_10810, partial [Cyanobacteria bacterium REEB65]|nr:hypothetical protein [Cyanobacteria bacterium REEB65]